MNRITLSKEQVEELVWNNKYKIEESKKPVNLDEFSVIISAGENFGFEVDKEKTKKEIHEMLGVSTIKDYSSFDGAILQLRGNYSITPSYSINTDDGEIKGNLFIFHETITNKVHRTIAKKLIENKAVKLFPGTDEEYLYEVLSESTEEHLYETVKKHVPGLPLYLVEFKDDGSFKVEELGEISS